MSTGPVRDRQNIVLRYNYFLNTLENSLGTESTPLHTLSSQYKDLLSFVQGLSKDEKRLIQRENMDWGADRRRDLLERCKQRQIC
mmetsp:Transcript_51221/g.136739  ORF Transcript_51221/g.136739 Transcript_51221/m.136739 type:complete len:85 (+) Transcript_51221:91-345(+)